MTSQATASQKRGIWITVASIVFIMTLFLALFFNKMLSPRVLSVDELRLNGAIVFENPRIIDEFSLFDQYGNAFSLDELTGKWTFLYYGFTHCPDICPTTLSDLNRLVTSLDEDIQKHVQVVMVTADPARDTPALLKSYINYFNQDFIGVTGEFFQIMKLAQNLNVAFNKVVMGDDYTIDHTGNLILINPKGHYHGFFKPPFELAKLKLTFQSIYTQSSL